MIGVPFRGIPPEQLRIHLCWGNYEGPHHYDVPLADILDLVFAARPQAISFEAANPRHAHEWRVFERVKLPPGKLIIPGVIDSTTNVRSRLLSPSLSPDGGEGCGRLASSCLLKRAGSEGRYSFMPRRATNQWC